MAPPIRIKLAIESVYPALSEHRRVDRVTRTVYGVKVLGPHSIHGRDYPVSVINRDHLQYEGQAVFLGVPGKMIATQYGIQSCFYHAKYKKGSRPPGPKVGILKSVRPKNGSVYANLYCEPGEAGDLILAAAESCPQSIGLSHVARYDGVREGGWRSRETVTNLGPIYYLEIVSEPATNKSLFEGTTMADEMAQPAAPQAMTVEQAMQALEMAVVSEYEGQDRIAALKICDKFRAQLLGDGEEAGGEEETGEEGSKEGQEGKEEATPRPVRGPMAELRADVKTLSDTVATLVAAMDKGRRFGGRELSATRSVAREGREAKEQTPPKQPQEPAYPLNGSAEDKARYWRS